MRPRHPNQRGIALVILLGAVVIMTVLILAFAVSMRTERLASASMAHNEHAKLLAQSALSHAVAVLDRNIPQPEPPGSPPTPNNWIVNPGLLTKVTGPGTGSVQEIPLSSNPSAGYVPREGQTPAELNDPNLNRKLVYANGYAITPTGEPIRVAWIPVLKDPLKPAGPGNPIVGRYAFWIDDESAKININSAYGKPDQGKMRFDRVNPLDTLGLSEADPGRYAKPDKVFPSAMLANTVGATPPRYYPLWHPSAVNLDVLGFTQAERNNLADWIYSGGNWRYLTAPDQVQRFLSASPATFYEEQRFNLTTSSRTPEFNAFGKPRLMLERRVNAGDELKFLRLPECDAQGPTYFHGFENSWMDPKEPDRDVNALQMVADSISDLLARSDWPGMPARSFVDKWGGGEAARREADQVAWNIVALGNYASGDEGNYEPQSDPGWGWPEQKETLFRFFQNNPMPNENVPTAVNPHTAKVTKRTLPANPKDGVKIDPNLFLCYGKLSGKAILPLYPRPLINEVSLKILPEEIENQPGKYRLRMWLEVEFYNGKRFPPNDIQHGWAVYFKLTHLDYSVKDAQTSAFQTASAYDNLNYDKDAPAFVRFLNGAVAKKDNAPPVRIAPDSYTVVQTLQGDVDTSTGAYLTDGHGNRKGAKYFYVRSGNAMKSSAYLTSGSDANPKPDPAVLGFQGDVDVTVNMRLMVGVKNNITRPCQLVPVWDESDGADALQPPPGESDGITFQFSFNVDELAGQVVSRSLEIADARTGGMSSPWKLTGGSPSPGEQFVDSLGAINEATLSAGLDLDKYAYLDFHNFFYKDSPRPSIGMLSFVHTGMQRGIPGAMLKFQPSPDASELPDWLLLDLLAPTVKPQTYRHSTMGRVNLNARIHPTDAGIERWQPLQAVFQNMRANTTVSSSATAPSEVVRNILDHRLVGADFGARGRYDYIGELCEIAGVADMGVDDWEKEMIIRNLAGLVSTQSNTFRVWGVAQTIRKNPANGNYGTFEAGDTVTGEKRFSAVVERAVWPGVDGIPGNAHADGGGRYDQIIVPAKATTKPWEAVGLTGPYDPSAAWAKLDGEHEPTYHPIGAWAKRPYEKTPQEGAYNPVGAQMHYTISSFEYLAD